MMSGRKIYRILDQYDFDWHKYGRSSVTASKNYLYCVINAYHKNAKTFRINSLDDGTFMIDNGIVNPNYAAYHVYEECIQEYDLAETFVRLVEENVDVSNLTSSQ